MTILLIPHLERRCTRQRSIAAFQPLQPLAVIVKTVLVKLRDPAKLIDTFHHFAHAFLGMLKPLLALFLISPEQLLVITMHTGEQFHCLSQSL